MTIPRKDRRLVIAVPPPEFPQYDAFLDEYARTFPEHRLTISKYTRAILWQYVEAMKDDPAVANATRAVPQGSALITASVVRR